MPLRLQRPETPIETLRVLAASGHRVIAPKALAEICQRKRAEIEAEMRAEMAKRQGGS